MASPFAILDRAERGFGGAAGLGAARERLYDARSLVEWLAKYINDGVDEYDAWRFVHYDLTSFVDEEWAEQVEAADDKMFDDLSAEEQTAFREWLAANRDDIVDQMLRESEAPAYAYLGDARVMPPKQWYCHFSDELFEAFDRGRNYEGLGISREHPEMAARCPTNLTNKVGVAEVVWGFAIEVPNRREALMMADKYGKHAVLFQTDYAVQAYHSSDDEYQVIFPLCSEYNLVQVSDPLEVRLYYLDEPVFDDLPAVVAWVEANKRRAYRLGVLQPSRMQKVFAALRAGEARRARVTSR